jgi:hypothetical protein
VAEKAKIFEDLPQKFYVKFAVTVSLYVGTLGLIFISMSFAVFKDIVILSEGIISFMIESGLYITLIVLYSSTIDLFSKIDLNMI